MKTKKLISALLVFVVIFTLIPFTIAANATTASERPRHAPNMYVDWPVGRGNYDIMTIDWYCEQDALNTYWAVNNWDNGYAGFQNLGGKTILLLSIWDDGTTNPKIEYGNGETFGGEGTGKKIVTDYDWVEGKWYTMLVKVWTENGESKYGQWVCDDEGKWLLTGIISCSGANRKFNKGFVFQEDFVFNNLPRKCRLKNAYGRFYDSGEWDSWDTYTIRSSYYAESDPNGQWDINFNCDWGKASNDSYIWLQSGGGDFTAQNQALPFNGTLTQPSMPIIKTPSIDNVMLTKNKSVWRVSWKLADMSTPAFSYNLEFLDKNNSIIRTEKCASYADNWSGTINSDITSIRITATDVFDQSSSKIIEIGDKWVISETVSPPTVGTSLGDVLYSDITAYINGETIPTSVINGKTLVVVEDLAKYGFDVVWDSKDKTLKVELDKDKEFNPISTEKDTTNKPGTFKEKYVCTDIKTYLSGQRVESFAINGVTLIDFDVLRKYGKITWDGKTREIRLVIE